MHPSRCSKKQKLTATDGRRPRLTGAVHLLGKSVLLFTLAFLPGCEAPLVLDAVEAEKQTVSRRTDMFQASAGNGQALVVVGGMGAVLSSSDEGNSWQRQVLPGKPFLIDIAACPDGRFVALDVGRRVWLGNASGAVWKEQAIDTIEALQAITCDPRNRIWVVGGFSSLLVSADDGKSWTTTSLDEDLHYTSIQFIDRDEGFASGEFGAVAHTSDGGVTWQPIAPLPDQFYPQDTLFLSATVGLAVGLKGVVFATHDGGQSWQRQETGTEAPLYGIAKDDKNLWVVGGNGVLLKAAPGETAGSFDWQVVKHDKPIRFYLRAVQPTAEGRLLVAGGYGVLFLLRG